MNIEEKEKQELEAYKKEVDKHDVHVISTYVIMMLIFIGIGILTSECLERRWRNISMVIRAGSIFSITGGFILHD